MKLFRIVLLFVGLLFFFFSFFIRPVLSRSTECMEESMVLFDSVSQQGATMDEPQTRKEFICSSGATGHERLLVCLQNAKSESFMGSFVLNDMPYAKANMRLILAKNIQMHNAVCTDHPLLESRI